MGKSGRLRTRRRSKHLDVMPLIREITENPVKLRNPTSLELQVGERGKAEEKSNSTQHLAIVGESKNKFAVLVDEKKKSSSTEGTKNKQSNILTVHALNYASASNGFVQKSNGSTNQSSWQGSSTHSGTARDETNERPVTVPKVDSGLKLNELRCESQSEEKPSKQENVPKVKNDKPSDKESGAIKFPSLPYKQPNTDMKWTSPTAGSMTSLSELQSTMLSSQKSDDLPYCPCKKYIHLGSPALRSKRLVEDNWQIPRLPKLRNLPASRSDESFWNRNTIYSRSNARLIDKSVKDPKKRPRGGLRSKRARPDGGMFSLPDGKLLYGDIKSMGVMERFERDKMLMPTVYKNLFSCPTKKHEYISALYTRDFRERNDHDPPCSVFKVRPSSPGCQFCDVLGERYCKHCIERKNRTFAKAYEEYYLPPVNINRATLVAPKLANVLIHGTRSVATPEESLRSERKKVNFRKV